MRSTGPSLALGALCALLLAGCPSGGAAGRDALEVAKARGKLIVATDAGYDPFEVLDKEGKITGFDIDLAREVAKDLGLELELKNVAWDGIIGELKTGKCDVIFSGMSVTDERKKTVSFSAPYFSVGQVVVKRKGDARIASFEDLNTPDMIVATQQATTGEQAIRSKLPLVAKAEHILRFPKADMACLAVIQKKADAVVFDHPFLMKYVAQRAEGDLEGLWTHFTSEPIAAACRPDSPGLVAAIDKTLARLVQDGTMQKLYLKHFKGASIAGAQTSGKAKSGKAKSGKAKSGKAKSKSAAKSGS